MPTPARTQLTLTLPLALLSLFCAAIAQADWSVSLWVRMNANNPPPEVTSVWPLYADTPVYHLPASGACAYDASDDTLLRACWYVNGARHVFTSPDGGDETNRGGQGPSLWHHWVWTFVTYPAEFCFYSDTQLWECRNSPSTWRRAALPDRLPVIGGEFGEFPGRVSDVRVFDSVLTAQEISALFLRSSSPYDADGDGDVDGTDLSILSAESAEWNREDWVFLVNDFGFDDWPE